MQVNKWPLHHNLQDRRGRKERKKRGLYMEIDTTDCRGTTPSSFDDKIKCSLLMRTNSIATKGNTTVQFLPFRVLVLWCMNRMNVDARIHNFIACNRNSSGIDATWQLTPGLNRCTYMSRSTTLERCKNASELASEVDQNPLQVGLISATPAL